MCEESQDTHNLEVFNAHKRLTWTGTASTASSILLCTSSFEQPRNKAPPIAPMRSAAHDCTTAQPAVIDTSPARQPFIAYPKLKVTSPVLCSWTIVSIHNAVTVPAAAASVVLIATLLTTS